MITITVEKRNSQWKVKTLRGTAMFPPAFTAAHCPHRFLCRSPL